MNMKKLKIHNLQWNKDCQLTQIIIYLNSWKNLFLVLLTPVMGSGSFNELFNGAHTRVSYTETISICDDNERNNVEILYCWCYMSMLSYTYSCICTKQRTENKCYLITSRIITTFSNSIIFFIQSFYFSMNCIEIIGCL
jgi:hypothetical protein